MSETTIVSIVVAALMSLPQILAQFVLFMQNRANASKLDTHDRKLDENTLVTKATEEKAEALVQQTVITEKKVDAVGGAVAAVKAEAKVISGHVNSSATASTAKIEALENKVLMLYELLAERKEAAALLAQAKSIEQAIGAEPVRVEVNNTSPEASLKRIDQHTEQIEKNTANTEAKVDDLKNGKVDDLKS